MRKPLRQLRVTRNQISVPEPFPAPVGGWDAVSALADMEPDRAVVLDNWFPSTGDVRVRRGHKSHAYIGAATAVESLLVYNGTTAASNKMFAAAGTVIYDASAAGNATSSVTSLTNARWQGVNFTTSAGHYLWICNGADAPRHYNGSAWATPSLTVTTYSAADIIQVNAHKGRIWVVFKDTTVAGYLASGAIAGTVTNFELGSLFTKGGYLVAMGTWTKDGGSGEDDFAAFISSRGQVAIYQGTDPSSASTWALVGVFDVGAPLGRRCFTKVAGDLALVNIDGILPLSKGLGQDRGAAAAVAITKNINNAINEATRLYSDHFGWELTAYPKGTMAILNVPISENGTQHQYVMNTLTGAWCRFTGMNANCWAVYNESLYFGGNGGNVFQADTTGTDYAATIDAVGQTAYSYFKSGGQLKQWKLLQPLITTDASSTPAIGISTDYKDNATLGNPTTATSVSSVYDTAVYDTAIYPIESRTIANWTTIEGIGQCASLHFRASTGPSSTPAMWGVTDWAAPSEYWSEQQSGDVTMRLNGFHVLYESGGVL